ncbi:serine/threonine-protein kinase SIK2 [Girardinichthys multiradiatus]|uniref:serine/threonine-protein kinase SIK2 n=1 Tax=Girardinichthys multiradiatus TaxID=208333 RepID=UPI001FAB6AC8|nr:serine/threonine-protein kinase SIK2 [Girardinichthys multiradiatus]
MAYSTGTLAKGCFGKVYRQRYNDTWAAVKKVPQQLIGRKNLERECEVYNKANHPNIVKLLGNITLKDGKWIIPLEFIFGEDLETTIFQSSKSKIQLTPSNKATIITGMCEGLLHLHLNDIVHQDLKPENIMVEHGTNRAVIIDLGLAKFFRHGLSSAIDMGNEAYSAPEVLTMGRQRSQRSDVWAMGKIIAELYVRIRLHTPSVGPAKIKETLQGQPYCDAVCRMVEPDPSRRATMAGVIDEIRVVGRAANPTSTPVERDLLKPPSTDNAAKNRAPLPMNRGANELNREPYPFKDGSPSPFNKDRSPLPFNKDGSPSPFKKDRSPLPFNKDGSPSPLRWERTPRPEFKHLRPQIGMPNPPFTKPMEDKNRQPGLVPPGRADVMPDLMKMRLQQKGAKDLPSNLPKTGKMVVRHIKQNNGKIETWEKTVVTEDGKIIRYEDVKINS